MGTITSEGLAQEYRVLAQLCATYTARLQARGITPEKLTAYGDAVTVMENQRAALEQAASVKKQLTQREETERNALTESIRIIQKGVKSAFADGTPQRKEFHIGDKLNSSTAHALGWAKDIRAGWETYKDVLITTGGLLQTDIDAMQTLANALEATDTAQEVAKRKTAPEATAAFSASIDVVRKEADTLHSVAAIEFRKEQVVANQFEQAKKLRLIQSSKNVNGETPPPVTPAPKP